MELRKWEMEIFEQNAFSNISLKMEGFGEVIYETPTKVFINRSSAHPAPEPASFLSRISLEKRLPSNLVQARWRGQLSTQQGASTPFISDSLLRKLSASLLLYFTLTAQKTLIFHSSIFPLLFLSFGVTPCSQNVLSMLEWHK